MITRLMWLILSLPLLAAAQDHESIRQEVDKLIRHETNIDLKDPPSFIVSIVDHEHIFHLGYGSFHPDSCQVDISDLQFQIGGLTKVFTAHLHQLLNPSPQQEEVSEILGKIDHSLGEITMIELLSHTSGLPKLPNNLGISDSSDSGRYAHYSWQHLEAFLRSNSLGKEKHLYSHVNYALIQLILENVNKDSFSNILRRHLLSPIGMDHSGVGLPTNAPAGHTRSGRPAAPWTFSSFQASEGMFSTAGDLSNYLQVCLSDSKYSKSFDALLEPISKVASSKRSYCGKAWHFFEDKGHRIYLHSGKTDGQGGVIQFVPETRTGVIILTNKISSFQGLGMEVLRMINHNWKRKETDGEEKTRRR